MDEESDIGTPKIGAVYKSGQFISLWLTWKDFQDIVCHAVTNV